MSAGLRGEEVAPVGVGTACASATAESAVAASEPAIALQDLGKIFGAFAPLRRVSAEIRSGQIALLLGENGAGKSTLLRLVAGLTSASRGTVRIFGEDPRKNGAESVRQRIAYVSHGTMLYDELSAAENLEYFQALRARGKDCGCSASPEMALRAVGLDHTLSRPVGQFSQGMRQRTALACALQADPDLLLLDEPFSNLDVMGVRAMLDLVADFRTWPSARTHTAGRTVLLTTHQAALALPIADTVLTLAGGVLTGEPVESYRRRVAMA